MTSRAPRLEWLPPLLVGASAAVVAEVALAMLLYGGPGFVRSLTTILAVEGFALAGGLWLAPAPGPDLVDRLRRRWLLGLFAFLAAAVFGTAWSLVPWLGEVRFGQAMGLAILAALPLYATGAVLAGISVAAASDAGDRLRGPGAAATAGAALGFVMTGLLLPRAPMPASLLVGCLVMLSLGGMIFGGVLGARTEIEVHARRPGPTGEVRVEERRVPSDGVARLDLREGEHLRRSRSLDEDGRTPWDVAVVKALLPGEHSEWRVLLVGGGCSSAVRAVLRGHPTATIDVVERSAAVIELGRDFFDTELSLGSDDRYSVAVGNLDDAIASVGYGYHLIVIDGAALAPVGGHRGLSTASRAALTRSLTPGGVIAWGPLGSEPGVEPLPVGWARSIVRREPSDAGASSELVTLTSRVGTMDRLPSVDGFEVGESAVSLPAPDSAAAVEASPR